MIALRFFFVLGVMGLCVACAMPPVLQALHRSAPKPIEITPPRGEPEADRPRTASAPPAPLDRATPSSVNGLREDAPSPSAVADRERASIEQLRARLEALGALELAFEQDNASPSRLCRFSCRVPLPDHALYSKEFVAEDQSPQAAMAQVLSEVQRWQSRW